MVTYTCLDDLVNIIINVFLPQLSQICSNVLKNPNLYQISTGVYGRVVLGPWNPQIDHEIFVSSIKHSL